MIIRASAIRYLWGFFLVHYLGLHMFLSSSVAFPIAFISLYCNVLSATDSEVVDCGHEILSYGLRYFFRFLPITVVVDWDHMYLN